LLLLVSDYSHQDFDHLRTEIVQGVDQTAIYNDYWNDADLELSSDQLKYLQEIRILIVSGFLSNVSARFRKAFERWNPIGSARIDEQILWMQKMGMDVERVPLESEASPQVNADHIRAAVLKSPKPVFFLSHSKGGIDILKAFQLYPELMDQTAGWVSVQTPFLGTPAADIWTRTPTHQTWAQRVLEFLGGSVDALLSLRVSERARDFSENEEEIISIMKNARLLSFGSWKLNEKGRLDTPFEVGFRNPMEKAGLLNDGIVPWTSTVLPGIDYIAVEGVDHITTIGAIQWRPFDRVQFLKALLKTWFDLQVE
jgi:hypothetical protein